MTGPAALPGTEAVPGPLVIDPAVVRPRLVSFIRAQLQAAGRDRLVLGLCGGVDSAVVAELAAEAVGPERLHCLIMPDRAPAPASRADGEAVARRLGCPAEVIEITPIVDAALSGVGDAGPRRRGDLAAWVRLALLHDRAAALDAAVIGTANKTETLLGYATRHGAGAGAFQPIGDLFRTQVVQLAGALGLLSAIVEAAADRWPGDGGGAGAGTGLPDPGTGLPDPVLDRLLQLLEDEARSIDAIVAEGFRRADAERVAALLRASAGSRQLPPVARIIARRHAHTDHG